ncbi:MAG: efflux RND transporter periplasmic adaptor subunit [Cytophagaceae bacterium]
MKLTAFLSVLVIAIAGCNRAEKQTNSAETHTEKEESIEYVTLTPTQIETVGIALGSFDTIAIKNLVKANGVLDLPPQNRATVTNILGGLITKINVIQGDRVKKGEVLAFIENPEILKIQQNYLEARTQLEYAKQEYLRQKELFEERIVAGKKFQAAEAEYKVSKTLVSSLESQLRQLGISPASVGGGNMIRQVPVTSPITGFVHRIEVNTGAYAEPARPLFEIVDNHHIHVDLQVYERDIHKVKEGQTVYFTLRGDTTEQYTAEIFSVG